MDYQLHPFRFVQIGLNLRDAPDKVKEGEWTRLHNIRSTQEAQIQAREGVDLFASTGVASSIHSLRRLGDSTLLVGVGTQVFRNNTAYATGGYSGNPLSIVPYRPSISSTPWAYIGDSLQMRKLRSDGSEAKWGITGPPNAASFASAGAGLLDSSVPGAIVYDWRYTYYASGTGAESNPSPTATGISLTLEQAGVQVDASTDPQVDQIKIYRRGGTLPNGWNLSLTVANVSGTYIDNNGDSTIVTGTTLSTSRDVPFTSIDASGNTTKETPLPCVWGPFAGKYIMACGAPNEPGYAFWTNAQAPDEAASTNKVEVTSPHEPLQNGLIYSSLPFVFSKDELYALNFGNPNAVTFFPAKTPVGRGLAAPWAFCIGDLIYFLSDDGIYATDGQSPARPITETSLRPLFRGIAVSDLNPVDYSETTKLRMAFSQQEVWFFYQDTSGAQRFLVYNTLYERWRSGSSSLTSFMTGYADENVSQARFLLGGSNGNVYEIDGSQSLDVSSAYSVNCRTGSIDFGAGSTLKEFGNVIIDCDPQGNTITVTPYINAEQTALDSFTLTGNGRQQFTRSLADTRAYNIAFDFSWGAALGGKIYQMGVMWRMEEEMIRHWEFITTHGLVGWQHVRDTYFCLISNAIVTFTLNVDGTDYEYEIPSTGGARLKQYIPLQPVKGKVFTYTLDCDSDFRIFGAECEVRVKPWNTSLGYQLTSPFQGGAVPA